MKYQNNGSKNLIFDKNFLNVHFSITMAHRDFIFCLYSLHIHSEGTVSQIFNIGLVFLFYVKKRETLTKICKHHFLSHIRYIVCPD